MTQNDVYVVGATRVVVGLSQVVKVSPSNNLTALGLKILAGGGTLEIVNAATLTGPGWGTGYPLGASEVLNIGGPATFYLAATGATMTAAVLMGRTAGATVI